MSKKIFALLFISIFLCSCVETVIVGTVVGGVIVAKDNHNGTKDLKQENKSSQSEDSKDEEIKKSAKKALKSGENSEVYRNINIIVFKERILLTGYVREAGYKKTAMNRISASQPNNEIINEISILKPGEKISGFNDYFISKKISIRLKKVEDINLSDYRYNVTNSVVTIMGKSKSKIQMDEITSTISKTSGVQKVISYIQY
ncbi:MAG: BON domain-containing protein [Rickettsiales bacterium]|nr:BON domain-containing protein [Rickettsiales bacterium]